MTRKDRRSPALGASNRADRPAGSRTQEHYNPVPMEEFDREQMGIAAKE